mmetsp:Transcript_11963/g.31636  ORF Transcript_11963/g.31636 Transcript_11963/m.31636 type:complete len:172 (+) Transcript_11963:40-555(+)
MAVSREAKLRSAVMRLPVLVGLIVAASAAAAAGNGVCPDVPTGALGTCIEECGGHADCTGGKLCCSNGCGHVCTEPVTSRKGGGKVKHVMMVSLAHKAKDGAAQAKDSAAQVSAAIPKPANAQLLSSVGIMILTYSPDQDAECCAARDILSGLKAVTNVEFDGAAPACKAF